MLVTIRESKLQSCNSQIFKYLKYSWVKTTLLWRHAYRRYQQSPSILLEKYQKYQKYENIPIFRGSLGYRWLESYSSYGISIEDITKKDKVQKLGASSWSKTSRQNLTASICWDLARRVPIFFSIFRTPIRYQLTNAKLFCCFGRLNKLGYSPKRTCSSSTKSSRATHEESCCIRMAGLVTARTLAAPGTKNSPNRGNRQSTQSVKTGKEVKIVKIRNQAKRNHLPTTI